MYIDVIEKTAAVSNEKDRRKGRRKGRSKEHSPLEKRQESGASAHVLTEFTRHHSHECICSSKSTGCRFTGDVNGF